MRRIEDMPKCADCGAAVREPQTVAQTVELCGTRWIVGVRRYECALCGGVRLVPYMERSYTVDVEAARHIAAERAR